MAPIVNAEGFPCSYEFFDGNRADVTTMEVKLRMVESNTSRRTAYWVMLSGAQDTGRPSQTHGELFEAHGYTPLSVK
jgi:hypothetical protein